MPDEVTRGMDMVVVPGEGPIDPDRLSFEQLVAALETLTERLATGQIGIEEAAELYEQAERLHDLARQRLDSVQARIDAVTRKPGPKGPG